MVIAQPSRGRAAALPSSPVGPVNGILATIAAASAKYGVGYDQMLRVGRCESGLNPYAVNRSSGASGLFQFMPATFYANGGSNIWNPVDQAETAAKMFSEGQAYQWTCR